jgi:hypothetical protein
VKEALRELTDGDQAAAADRDTRADENGRFSSDGCGQHTPRTPSADRIASSRVRCEALNATIANRPTPDRATATEPNRLRSAAAVRSAHIESATRRERDIVQGNGGNQNGFVERASENTLRHQHRPNTPHKLAARHAEQEAEGRATGREQEALDQQEPRDAPTARADAHANGELALASDAAREQEPGPVHRGDQRDDSRQRGEPRQPGKRPEQTPCAEGVREQGHGEGSEHVEVPRGDEVRCHLLGAERGRYVGRPARVPGQGWMAMARWRRSSSAGEERSR